MSEPKSDTRNFSQVSFAILVGVFAFLFGEYILVVFAPLVTYYVWTDHLRTRELERRLAELEKSGSGSRQ